MLSGLVLTTSGAIFIQQDLADRRPHQHVTAVLADGVADVVRDLAGAPFGIVGSTLVVVDEEGVDEDAGVPGGNAYGTGKRDNVREVRGQR